MARIQKEEDFATKRNEILDSAQKLIYSCGYEAISIQDILNDLHISKGAFYHYFDSKQDLLEALVDRILVEMQPMIRAIVDDPNTTALDKFRRFFESTGRWKTERKDYLLAFLRVWYDDKNAIFRQKVYTKGLRMLAPLLSEIARQGNREGTLDIDAPDQVGPIVFSLFQSMSDSAVLFFLRTDLQQEDIEQADAMFSTYSRALERILGAPVGSLQLLEKDLLQQWISPNPKKG